MGNHCASLLGKQKTTRQCDDNIPNFSFGVEDMITIKKHPINQVYHIYRRPIACGSYGQVFKAIHRETEVVRAIKKIQTKQLGNQFMILKQLDHPNILKIYQMYDEGQYCYIVTEFYEGGSLANILAKSKYFNQTTVLKIMFQLLSAVNYLHSKNIIHGDIKPENILVDEKTMKVCLADFGLSTYESKTVCKPTGTECFMAPDGSRKFCQKKFDIWACGVTMYLLFTGKIPPHVQRLQRDFEYSRCAHISVEAKDLILKLLHLDPYSRITAKQALFHGWFTNIHNQFYTGSTEWLRNMVQNMLQNTTKNSMQRLVIFYIANFIIPCERRKCFQYFTAFDRNLDGVIAKDQFTRIFQKLNIKQDIDRVYDAIDTNRSGNIDYAQFLTFVSGSQNLLQDYSIQKAFQWLDNNNDKVISKEQIQQCLNKNLPIQVVNQIMKMCDTNQNGFIQFDEFVKFIKA